MLLRMLCITTLFLEFPDLLCPVCGLDPHECTLRRRNERHPRNMAEMKFGRLHESDVSLSESKCVRPFSQAKACYLIRLTEITVLGDWYFDRSIRNHHSPFWISLPATTYPTLEIQTNTCIMDAGYQCQVITKIPRSYWRSMMVGSLHIRDNDGPVPQAFPSSVRLWCYI